MVESNKYRSEKTMIKIQSNCQQCGLPCLKDNCPHYRVKTLICDKCKDEVYILYYAPQSGKEVCIECAVGELEKVKVD